MAIDHPDRVWRLAVLYIVPTYKIYTETDRGIAEDYYHFSFIQPADYPERMIGNDVPYYLNKKMGKCPFGDDVFTEAAKAEYLRCFNNPETIHAACEDYHAAVTIDFEHDRADLDTKLTQPLLALWGKKGAMAGNYDVLEAWRERAIDVSGHALPCGHYFAEERLSEILNALKDLFTL